MRSLLTSLLEQRNITCANEFIHDIYRLLSSETCFVEGERWVTHMLQLFSMLSTDNIDVLREMASHSCLLPDMSLLQEVDAYYRRRLDALETELQVFSDMSPLLTFGMSWNNRDRRHE